MNRKMFEPTEKQECKWAEYGKTEIPSDEEFKVRWAKSHHGKEKGWGMGKRDYALSHMKYSREYQMGIWQGRVDKARGLSYSEDRNENTYNLGYNRGYASYESNRRGWDAQTRQRFDDKYVNC